MQRSMPNQHRPSASFSLRLVVSQRAMSLHGMDAMISAVQRGDVQERGLARSLMGFIGQLKTILVVYRYASLDHFYPYVYIYICT